MTGTNCDLFTHKSSRSYLNHLVYVGDVLLSRQVSCLRCAEHQVANTRKKFCFQIIIKSELSLTLHQLLFIMTSRLLHRQLCENVLPF
jgi:hypothetical protein